ncbi:MAG TPA: sterol desaturase family protein [Bryobacteraceae bacterium]|nr:sterol desaturase family protein [Bryobacteraceae bacterium]
MMPRSEIRGWLTGALVGGTAVALFYLESRQALRRKRREDRFTRTGRNLMIAGLAGAVMNVVEAPLLRRMSSHVDANELGLAYTVSRNPVVRVILGVVLLDYGLYLWHVLTHKIPWLWRFHLVHHIDLDLDTSTAIRFHFGEMLLSVPWRVAQARIAGSGPAAVSIWQTLLLISILFHHSNVRLPIAFERRLRWFIATPRLHGIHHRPERGCLDSNWSSGLSIWDMLHGTHCWREDEQLGTGVPGYQATTDVTLRRCLVLPFEAPSGTHRAEHSLPGA